MEFDIPTAQHPTMEFKSKVIGSGMNINRELGTIDDVIIIEVGEAEGHGFHVEATFLEALVKYVKKDLSGRLQCNMGHRYDSLFFQLGRFDNIRLSEDGKKVIGKFTAFKAAEKSPALPGMSSWFFDMAEEDPESVMCSIKFRAGGFYQYDPKGNKVYIQDSWYGPSKQFKDKPAYVEFSKVFSCDIVDTGALTSSLFSEGSQGAARTFGEIVNAPGFMDWLRANEQHFPQLQQYFHEKNEFSLTKIFKNIFSNPHNQMDPKTPDAAAAATPETLEVSATTDAATTDLKAAIAEALAPITQEITELKAQLTSKDAEITALKATPAATPVAVKDDNPSRIDAAEETNLWDQNPINIKARSNQRASK
jgi:hypothetical protein